MKKSFLTFAVIALVLSFTSCKETPAENAEESAVEVMETPVETPIDTVGIETEEIPAEEVADSTSTGGTVAEDNAHTTSIE